MNLRNFVVYENNDLALHGLISDRIGEVEALINKLYLAFDKEVAVEYNFGSIMQQYEISLVIYNNPERNNNPYVFMYIDTDQYHILLDRAELALFSSFTNDERYRDFKHSLEVGFKNAPKMAFLGERELNQARQFAKEYDAR